MSFNKVIIQGNVSSEVECKQTQNGTSVCSFNVAVNRFSKEPDAKKVDFFTIVAWQAKADFVSRYFKKGSPILVCGRLENREWQDKQGNKRITAEVIAEEISFCNYTSEEKKPSQGVPYVPGEYASKMEEIAMDSDLPF